MDIVFTVLILLLAVSASGVVTRILPIALPLPLVQIAIGALLAWPRLGLHVTFDPEIFMVLFIPPLLFADGWRIPKRELFMARRSILMLALGLVFMTVLAVGYFVHALVPSISLPVAFALAAVLSPTDAVALTGIVGKGRIPGRLMHILEGEALMNDASGLVALKFAIAAALTGVFSLRDASISFVIIAVGGLATGAAVSWLVSFVSARFLSRALPGLFACAALVRLYAYGVGLSLICYWSISVAPVRGRHLLFFACCKEKQPYWKSSTGCFLLADWPHGKAAGPRILWTSADRASGRARIG
jgi:CPA1 family monovalent cation:H+ antiporter